MALENPNVWDVSYQHPAGYDRSAVRLVVYLFRRPDGGKQNAGSSSSWSTVPEGRRLGDARAFIRAADARTQEIRQDAEQRGKDLARNKAPWCSSFVHVVLSPASRAELSDESLLRLAEPWVRDAEGRTMPHVGAVHREGGGHLHLALVRDKFSRDELRDLKEATDGLTMSLEQELEQDQQLEQERTLKQQQEQERELAHAGAGEMDREELSDGLEL